MADLSFTPDITEAMPGPLGSGTAEVSAAYPPALGWDVTFGGLGFRLRATDQAPYRRETDQVTKQQIDTSTEAGEQSLSSWWARSQASWHMGAGTTWYEPGAEVETRNRFADSCGVNPWDPGKLTLLHRCDPVGSASASALHLSTMRIGAVDGYLAVAGNEVRWSPAGGSEVTATLAAGGGTQPTTFGSSAWIGHTGGVAKYNVATATLTEPFTAAAACRAWWVKSRLIVAVGASLYEVVPTTTGAVETVGTLLYTHPDASWVWVDVDESGAAIIAGGYADAESAIYRFSVENDTAGNPQLSGASQVARMPPGEQLRSMRTYLGAYLVLGTTSGARVGLTAPSGEIEYGPITVASSTPVVNMTFRDRFAYVVATACQPDGTTGAARIDLSAPIEDTGRYAWAWDASTGVTDAASSICFVGHQDRVVLAAGGKRYVQSATAFVDEGWLLSGKIRFRTVEQKAFRLARLICELNGGEVKLTALAPDASEHRVYTYSKDSATTHDIGITIPGRAVNQYLSFRVTLTGPTDNLTSPEVSGFAVKAVPAASRMRLIQFPVSVYDFEMDRGGVRYGKQGGALSRLLALEAMEETARPVTVRHLTANDAFIGLIEGVSFSSAGSPDRSQSGFGGTALVTVRKL